MGLGDRRPFLPAATDSVIESAEDYPVEQDLATDLSKLTDRSSHTIPDDGRPITIATAQKRSALSKLTKSASQSQTSLLIEYFEAGHGTDRKPSVRVKVTPSNSNKSRNKEGHVVVTESQSVARPSQSHRIALGSNNLVNDSVSAVDSELPFGRSKAPVDIEVYQGSDLSVPSDLPDPRFRMADSDISSMPADSMLGVSQPAIMTHRAPSGSISRGEISAISEISEKENLRPPVILPTGLNKSNERLARNVAEKIAKSRGHTTKSALTEQSRSRSSVGREFDVVEPRRRTVKNIEDDSITATGSSLVSGSALSAEARTHDQHSVRSGNSNLSINNPRLLQTVEDAIRRLILPELKEIKKDQRHGSHSKRSKELSPSESFDSSNVSREETTRRRSSGKTKHRSSREHGQRVSSGSRRHTKTVDYDSPSEQSYRESIESASVDGDRKSRKHRSHRVRDATAGALAGAALTAAALKHHESSSSLDHRERRKKRSKSRSSRNASVAESDEIFHKHDIPPMPMRSDIGSELTRSSLLSSNTNGTATPTRREVREVLRSSPRELLSPDSQTPSRTPVEKPSSNKSVDIMQRGLGTHHGNLSEQDLATHRELGDAETEGPSPNFARDGFGAVGADLLTDPERARAYERNLHHQHPIRRGLSPIQSVASYATTEPNRNSLIHPKSSDSLSSPNKDRGIKDQISIASLSSDPSTDLAKSLRPQGMSLENRSEIMQPHKVGSAEARRDLDVDDFYEDQHSQNDQYRGSHTSGSPYVDKVTAGQQLGLAYRANPEYIHSPHEVESAVASLYEPSVLDSRGNFSQSHSNHSRSLDHVGNFSPHSVGREMDLPKSGSPLKRQFSFQSQDSYQEEGALSPIQSVTASPGPLANTQYNAREVEVPALISEGQDAQSPESEITTNPSVIQGPIAGYEHGNRDHWPYDPSPPPVKNDMITGATRDLGLAPPDLVPEALSINHAPPPEGKRTIHIAAPPAQTPPGMIDEGYDTGAHAPSPVPLPRAMPPNDPFTTVMGLNDPLDDEDNPLATQKYNKHISGLSQGMSPLYDSATGKGIDRIQSEDIVALMDHLTVRDAQRNARDTEILVTLVRTAAEMRNSFEDIKKFISEQDDMIVDSAEKQHERTQKAVGGPRPQPPPASTRFARTPAQSEDEQDLPAKRRNIFKRAVRGLGTKNSQELQNIEAMLMQLLNDVEGLRTVQSTGASGNDARSVSFASADNHRLPTDPGYEPEGQAGTSSTGGRSGIYSGNSSRQANYQSFGRQESANRVSTVLEGDEDYENLPEQTTPKATFARDAAESYQTPPRTATANKAALSNENTPQYSTETTSSGRKHKSFASAFLPKMVSRWSKTTASSAGDYRNTLTKPRPYSRVSQSGSNLGEYEYDPQGDDRLRSNTSFQNEQDRTHPQPDENRPPSPLMPSTVSDINPKYQAHRNSLNLQHPQPRQGPTGRFQHHLESEAQTYNDPTSPTSVTSSQWEAQAGLTSMPGAGPNGTLTYQHGGHLSPISDGGYSETSTAMANRDRSGHRSVSAQSASKQEPLFPPRKPVKASAGISPSTYVDQVAAARAGSPALDKSPVAALRNGNSPAGVRKPSGPRPISGSGQYSSPKAAMGMVKKTRFRGSPYHIDSEEDVFD